jgi:hypothetical protein
MGLDIWFKEDIANALQAAEESVAGAIAMAEPTADLTAYQAGFRAALKTLAVAFGVSPSFASDADRSTRLTLQIPARQISSRRTTP